MFWNQLLGHKGETRAARHLRRKGFKIIARRYRTRFGEIDLIVRKKRLLCFVEVKTRASPNFGDPLEAITAYKLHHLKRSALAFLQRHPIYRKEYEIALMAVAIRRYDHEKPIECVHFSLD